MHNKINELQVELLVGFVSVGVFSTGTDHTNTRLKEKVQKPPRGQFHLAIPLRLRLLLKFYFLIFMKSIAIVVAALSIVLSGVLAVPGSTVSRMFRSDSTTKNVDDEMPTYKTPSKRHRIFPPTPDTVDDLSEEELSDYDPRVTVEHYIERINTLIDDMDEQDPVSKYVAMVQLSELLSDNIVPSVIQTSTTSQDDQQLAREIEFAAETIDMSISQMNARLPLSPKAESEFLEPVFASMMQDTLQRFDNVKTLLEEALN